MAGDDTSVRACPHCGNLVSMEARHCACGFPLPADRPVFPGPKAAREVTERTLPPQPLKVKAAKKPLPRKPGRLAKTLKSVRGSKKTRSKSPPASPQPVPRAPDPPTNPPRPPTPRSHKPTPTRGVGANLMGCTACGVQISKRAVTCPKCGSTPWAECRICGAKIRTGPTWCPECGDPDPFNP